MLLNNFSKILMDTERYGERGRVYTPKGAVLTFGEGGVKRTTYFPEGKKPEKPETNEDDLPELDIEKNLVETNGQKFERLKKEFFKTKNVLIRLGLKEEVIDEKYGKYFNFYVTQTKYNVAKRDYTNALKMLSNLEDLVYEIRVFADKKEEEGLERNKDIDNVINYVDEKFDNREVYYQKHRDFVEKIKGLANKPSQIDKWLELIKRQIDDRNFDTYEEARSNLETTLQKLNPNFYDTREGSLKYLKEKPIEPVSHGGVPTKGNYLAFNNIEIPIQNKPLNQETERMKIEQAEKEKGVFGRVKGVLGEIFNNSVVSGWIKKLF
jgi:hypothetical protein